MLTNSPDFHQKNLFGDDLLQQLDPKDSLLQLAQVIPWNDFDDAFSHHQIKGSASLILS